MELAEDALKDIINPDKPKEITPELIIEVVAEHFGVSPEDITPKNGTPNSFSRVRLSCICAGS